MLATGCVASFENFFVRRPALADLDPQLFFYAIQGIAFHTAELRGLVFDAEQEGVLVFDAPLLRAVGLFDADAALLLELQLGYGGAVDLVWAVGQTQDARLGPEGG